MSKNKISVTSNNSYAQSLFELASESNALSEIEKGVSINKLYQILYEFEKNEEYKACAGILKAIKKKNEIS